LIRYKKQCFIQIFSCDTINGNIFKYKF